MQRHVFGRYHEINGARDRILYCFYISDGYENFYSFGLN